jgi:hypothetical protein
MLPRYHSEAVTHDTMYAKARTMVFWSVMISARDLIRVLCFPPPAGFGLDFASSPSLTSPTARKRKSLFPWGVVLRGLPLLYSPKCREKDNSAKFALPEFSEVRGAPFVLWSTYCSIAQNPPSDRGRMRPLANLVGAAENRPR